MLAEAELELAVNILYILVWLTCVIYLVVSIYKKSREHALNKCCACLYEIQDRAFQLFDEEYRYWNNVGLSVSDKVDPRDVGRLRDRIDRAIRILPYVSWTTYSRHKDDEDVDVRVSEHNKWWEHVTKEYTGKILQEFIEIDKETTSCVYSAYCWNSPINTAWRWLTGTKCEAIEGY
jgi:hypothetical protein